MGKLGHSYPSTVNIVINDFINIYLEPSLYTKIILSTVLIMAQPIHDDLLFKSNSWSCFQTIKLFAMQIKSFFEIDSYESFIHGS